MKKGFSRESLFDRWKERRREKETSGCANEVTPFVSLVVLVSLHFALEIALLHGNYFRARAILMTVHFFSKLGIVSSTGFKDAPSFSCNIEQFRTIIGIGYWDSVYGYSLKFKTLQSQRITRVATNRETRFDSSFVGDVAFFRGKSSNFCRNLQIVTRTRVSGFFILTLTVFAGDKPKDNRVPVENDSAWNSEIQDRLRVVKPFSGSQPACSPLGIL